MAFDAYLSAPGQASAPDAAPDAIAASSSWPNLARSSSRRYASTMPTAGSAGSLSAALLGQPSAQPPEGLGAAAGAGGSAGSLQGLDSLLPARAGADTGPAGAAQQPSRALASRHARSASDVTSSWGMQAHAVYLVPDPRMQLLSQPAPDASAGQLCASAPGSARASSTGAAAAAHRSSMDVLSRPALPRGHSRSRSMGYDPSVWQQQVGLSLHPTSSGTAAEGAGTRDGPFSSPSLTQQQQQPQHRRLSSWLSKPQQQAPTAAEPGLGLPGARTSPTQVFSSWLYGAQSLPTPPRAPVPIPIWGQQSQRTTASPLSQPVCSPDDDPGSPRRGLLAIAWHWLWSAAARLLSDGSGGWEAGLCYVLFVAAFAMDASVMTLVYFASMLVVPLLAQKPVKLYWKALLVYTEVRLQNR